MIEIFNEVMCLLSTYGMIVFTDFVPDPNARYQFGWVIIGITMAILVVNTLIMFYMTITGGYRSVKIKHSKRKYMNTLRARKEAAEA